MRQNSRILFRALNARFAFSLIHELGVSARAHFQWSILVRSRDVSFSLASAKASTCIFCFSYAARRYCQFSSFSDRYRRREWKPRPDKNDFSRRARARAPTVRHLSTFSAAPTNDYRSVGLSTIHYMLIYMLIRPVDQLQRTLDL